MFWLERCAVDALTTTPAGGPGPARSAARAFVAGSLRAMPRHLRLGTAALSVLLGARVRVRHGATPDPESVRRHLDRWLRSPIGPLRQYARLLVSLTLFAVEEDAGSPRRLALPSGAPPG